MAKEKKKPPAAPSAPVLQEDSTLDLLITPPPYSLPPPIQPEPPLPQPSPEAAGGGPAMNTRNRRAASPGGPANSTSAAILPLRALCPPDADGNQPLQYWPFSTSDLYNWRTQNAPFSERPKELINLLETVLFTHQPTWDDCQQLLQILFTTEERERIQLEARKLVPGDNGQPMANPATINSSFPLSRPQWDYITRRKVSSSSGSTARLCWGVSKRPLAGPLLWLR